MRKSLGAYEVVFDSSTRQRSRLLTESGTASGVRLMALPKREFTASEFAFLACSARSSPTSKPGKALACCAKRAGGGQTVFSRIPPPPFQHHLGAEQSTPTQNKCKMIRSSLLCMLPQESPNAWIVLFRQVLGVLGRAERWGFKTRTDRNAPPLPKHTVPFEAESVLLPTTEPQPRSPSAGCR